MSSSENEDFEDDDLSDLSIGSLLVDVLRRKPDLETELALCLDRETWVKPNWVQLSREVKVDEKVISDLEAYTDRSPTIRLFEHLKSVNESLTIQQLKQALRDIRRDDLYILLRTKGFLDSEVVSREITSRNIDTSSTRFGCLDQLALELDGESQVLGNWQSLAQKLGVTFHALKMLQRKSYSNREATFQLFRHLRFRHRSMTVKTLKEALAKMKRGDVLKILQEFYYFRASGKFDG